MKLTDIILENEEEKKARAKIVLKALKKGEFKIVTTGGPLTLKYNIIKEPKIDYRDAFGGRFLEVDFAPVNEDIVVKIEIIPDDPTKAPPNLNKYPTYLNYLRVFCSRIEKRLAKFDIYVSVI